MKNQAPAVGASNIATSQIDAHADFCPWSEIMEFRGTGRKIYDGSETGVPYLHGVVVREDFAKQYPEVVVAFIEAVYEAGEWIKADPMRAVEMMEKWTGVEKEVLYLYFSKGGYLTLDPTIKPAWVDDPEIRPQVLVKEKRDRRRSISTPGSPIRSCGPPTRTSVSTTTPSAAKVVDPVKANDGLPMEIWHARDGIKTYPTMTEFLKAVADFNADRRASSTPPTSTTRRPASSCSARPPSM